MKKKLLPRQNSFSLPVWIFPLLGLLLLFLAAYGRLLFHPALHTACPENDTWNLPVRWSVLSSLRSGNLPLWNPLSAFGIPWLATWQTETFYPGTLLFTWMGLDAWNLSGVLHLFVFSLGLYYFLKGSGVDPFWAFFCSAVAGMNACAYNHLGSNSSMDTLAWMPWIFLAVDRTLAGVPCAGFQLALFLTLQVFAGYPQILFYTSVGAFAYAAFLKGWRSLPRLAPAFLAALFLSACQWVPSAEYFLFHAVRKPAVPSNPGFFLPFDNLKTFLAFNSLWKGGTPDYVESPTFFYFNFYSGLLPLGFLAVGLLRFKRLGGRTRFFFLGFCVSLLWVFGIPLRLFPFSASFLEPAKAWVLADFLELCALGFLLKDLFPKLRPWRWGVLALALADLFVPLWTHPLETNLAPSDPFLQSQAGKIRRELGSGRLLVLPNAEEHAGLYTPLPNPEKMGVFKRFLPNSNLLVSLPLANFYGSTWPTWGALDAQLYFQYGFPYDRGALMDLLGVDLLLLTEDKMPRRFRKIGSEGAWTLWANPSSLGECFFFPGGTRGGSRKESFQSFASGTAHPLQTLFLDPEPLSSAPLNSLPRSSPGKVYPLPGRKGCFVAAQNAMPGWRAWVDGKPSGVHLADGIFQGVPVAEGSRQVTLRYEPVSFRFGLFLSLLAWAGLGGILGLRLCRKTRKFG